MLHTRLFTVQFGSVRVWSHRNTRIKLVRLKKFGPDFDPIDDRVKLVEFSRIRVEFGENDEF